MEGTRNKLLKYGIYLVLILIFVVYFKSLFFDFVMLDDDIKIIDNYEKISDLKNIPDAFYSDSYFQKEGLYYRPTLTLTLMFDAIIGGKETFGYHLTNLILHIIACLLLYYFLRLFINNRTENKLTLNTHNLTLFIVALFGVSPLLLNAVAWIPGRNDILLTIFILLSFWFYTKSVETDKFSFTALHFLFFLLALFSKETALVFPLILLLYSILLKRTKLFTKTNITLIIQWTVIILYYLHLRNNVVLPMQDIKMLYDNFIYNLPLIPELIGKFFIPYNLTGIPGYSLLNSIIGVVILAVMITLIVLNKKERNILLFAFLWIIITVLPGMFASRGATNFDYLECRAYLPMIGVVFFIYTLMNNHNVTNNYYVKLIFSFVIVIYSVLNILLSSSYSSPINFYNNAVEKNQNSAIAFNNRSLILQGQGKIREAISDFEMAIKIDPGFAEVYFNLGSLLDRTGNSSQALLLYNAGLKIKKDAPKVYFMRANIKLKSGDRSGAEEDYKLALKYDSTESRALFAIGNIYFQKGNLPEAIKYFGVAIKNNPKYFQAYFNRAVTYAHLRNFDKAIKDYNSAEKLDTNNNSLYYFRANAKLMNSDTMGACLDWYRAAQLGNREAPVLISQFCR